MDKHGYLRITDFGIARQLREDNSKDTSGTPGYMAPEVLARQRHSFTADYFALGVIAHELMLGCRPYNGRSRDEIRKQIDERNIKISKN
jgi:serine/threonine protein kinase